TLASLGGASVLDKILPYLEEENLEIKKGAMVGLLKSGGIQGVLLAGMDLLKKVGSENAMDRICAAQVLGEVGIQDFYQPLLQLLKDKDPMVRQHALVSAGKLKNPKLWPLVIENLGLPMNREFAINALVSGGENALHDISVAFCQNNTHKETQYWMIRTLGQIKGDKSIEILLGQFEIEDKNVFSQMLLALSLCGYAEKTSLSENSLIKSRLKKECCDATFLLIQIKAFEKASWCLFLTSALENEFRQAQKRIFYLLSFIYDSHIILEAFENLYHPVSERRAYTIEILDNLIAPEIKTFVFPLIDNIPMEKRLASLVKEFPQISKTLPERLQDISCQSEIWHCFWLQACALYSMAQAKHPGNIQHLLDCIKHPNPLIKETAIWAFSELRGKNWESALENIQDETTKEWIFHVSENRQEQASMLLTINKVQFLKKISIFSEIPEDSLSKIVPYFQLMNVEKGNIVFEEGKPGDTLYIVLQGKVHVYNKKGTIAYLGTNEVFGEFSLWDSQPRSASVVAEQKTSLIYLNKSTLDSIIIERPEILKSIIKVLCRRLKQHIPALVKKETASLIQEKENLLPLEKVLFLKTIPFFASIPDKVLEEILSITKEEKHDKGTNIITKGCIVKYIYVILSGQVALQEDNNVLGYWESGEIFGELFLFDSDPASASIKAEKNTHLLAIDKESFCEMIEDRVEMSKGIIYSLIQKHRTVLAKPD
ncbi:MAG: cyclic nucleotide-binding domain-containing protein, partial [Candidatus Brocadiae bacterium]|nr:cyclic nucleotide-binding domain-containing protein [Candidatus Brocadiia bacterium]